LRSQRELGFEYIELEGIYEDNLKEVFHSRQALKKECDDLGLEVVNFSPILPDLVSLDKGKREKALDLYRTGVELAVYFGASTVQMDSYAPPLKFAGNLPYTDVIRYGEQYQVEVDPDFVWGDLWNVVVESTARCNDMAKAANLKLVMEPRVGEIVSNTDALLRLMDAVGDPNVGAILDTSHLNAQKEILVLSVEKMAGRIYYLHVADNDGRENEHLVPGDGSIDWKGVFACLRKHRFDGYVAIDVGNVPDLDEAYRRSISFLRSIEEEAAI
jgi:sugar phosphate isomerase/epimerase